MAKNGNGKQLIAIIGLFLTILTMIVLSFVYWSSEISECRAFAMAEDDKFKDEINESLNEIEAAVKDIWDYLILERIKE